MGSRTADDILSRQQSIGLTIPNSVAIVGCGGVGSWVACFLAMAGVGNLWLFDEDEVSSTNLNRLPYDRSAIGIKKTVAARNFIQLIRPSCTVVCCGNFSSKLAVTLSLKKEVSWIVAATDTLRSRLMVYEWAQVANIRYIEVSAEGEIGGVTGEPARFFTEEENQPGYASVPVHAVPCVLSAATATNYVLHNTVPQGTIRMGWNQTAFEFYKHE